LRNDRQAELAESQTTAVDDSSLDRYPLEGGALRRPGPDIQRPGVIPAPRTDRESQLGPFDPRMDGRLVVTGNINPVSVEEYRRLAATLHKMQAERAIKTLMVTSACPGEGKTLTVTNLALTLSEFFGRRVLLIDGDLRRPSIHQTLRLANTTGLGDALRSDRTPLAFIDVSPTLKVLPVGHVDPDSMAGLASDRMKTLIDEAATRFDWVLVDTPPIGLLSDARFITGFVDGVLLVISAGQTPYQLVQRAIAEVGAERIIGTVMNRFEGRRGGSNRSYLDYYTSAGANHG
jgi:capsular exopolysaccharide synthesis family protein